MHRHPTTDHVVWFEPDEVAEMIREKLRAAGIDRAPIGVQIVVEQPFADGSKVHNEVPRLNVILAGAGM